jgi:hypothetical protein
VVQRTVKVYDQVWGLEPHWQNAQSLIVVERQGTRDGQDFHTLSYYLSSLRLSADEFADLIRGHRHIENR